jgi:hypothetical protein
MNSSDLPKWQRLIENALQGVLKKRYPGYVDTYNRFRKKNGPNCPFCKSSAKFMYLSELSRDTDFLRRFENDDWQGYE